MFYILFYKTVDNYVERRVHFRTEHLAYANKYYEEGKLILAGALVDPVDEAILVFKSDSKSIPEEFAKNDPYVLNGLITEWQVRPWNVVIGNF